MFSRKILEQVFPDETGASRLQQIGIFTLIFAGGDAGEPLSASQIAELTKHDTSQLARLLRKLIDRDLIERRPGPGRGAPQLLSVKHSPASKKLIDAMTKR